MVISALSAPVIVRTWLVEIYICFSRASGVGLAVVTLSSFAEPSWGSTPFSAFVIAGVPSWAAFWTTTWTVPCFVVVPSLTVTGMDTICVKSCPFHTRSVGVPSTLPCVLTFNPWVVVEVIVTLPASALCETTSSSPEYDLCSTAGVLGLIKLTSKPPSASLFGLCVSFSSGIPFLSASLRTITDTLPVLVWPLNVTVTSKSTVLRCTGWPFCVQSVITGVPVNFPCSLIVRPHLVTGVILDWRLFDVITSIGDLMGVPSTSGRGCVVVT